MISKAMSEKKEKVTVTIDADLLRLIDSFVDETKHLGNSRSSVFEQALYSWKQSLRDQFDAQYYAENAESLRDKSWTAITTEAAKHIWNE